jgi:TolB-like protein
MLVEFASVVDALPDKPSLVVLPFQNMSGDPEQEYFVDGMVEEITTAIARLPWLFAIARNSAFTYKGRAVDVKQVAQELRVRYVLEGSVRKAGNRVRIAGQLIDTTTGAHIWAPRFVRARRSSRSERSGNRRGRSRRARRHFRAARSGCVQRRRRDRTKAAPIRDRTGQP